MATSERGLVRIARRLQHEFAYQSGRARRWLWQKRHLDAGDRSAVFVVGCQRSGTNMVMWTLERSPAVWVWHEHERSVAFLHYRLRSTRRVEELVRTSAAPVVVFKPICDAHLTDRLLERHAGSRAIWIYRGYRDVANSAARNFGDHMRDILRWIVDGDTDWLGWRGERLGPEAVAVVREVYRDDMPLEEASAVFWWLRNHFFFELGLDHDERVLLVRYEDLVSGGEARLRELFDFTGVAWKPGYARDIFATSVGKDVFPAVEGRVHELCGALQDRLDAAYRARLDTGGPRVEASA